MNTVDVNDQVVNIAQIVRKCPGATLRRAYTRALREWCQQTQWLRMDVGGVTALDPNSTTGAYAQQYNLGNDPQLDICGIFAMNGVQLSLGQPQSFGIAASNSQGWDPNIAPGAPLQYAYLPEGGFALFPIPNAVYQLLITVIVEPKEGAINIPASPLIKYSNEIEAGALAYLFAIPGQPWSSPVMSAQNAKQFQAGISNGKAEVQRSYNVGAQRSTPRSFGGLQRRWVT